MKDECLVENIHLTSHRQPSHASHLLRCTSMPGEADANTSTSAEAAAWEAVLSCFKIDPQRIWKHQRHVSPNHSEPVKEHLRPDSSCLIPQIYLDTVVFGWFHRFPIFGSQIPTAGCSCTEFGALNCLLLFSCARTRCTNRWGSGAQNVLGVLGMWH